MSPVAASSARLVSTCALVAVLLLGPACDGCGCGQDALAELVEADGPAQRDHAGEVGQWQDATVGEQFRVGDGLRTGDGGRAVVELIRGGRLRLGEQALVRFLPKERDAVVELALGDLEVLGSDAELAIETPRGRMVIESGTELRLHVGGDEGLGFELRLGGAQFIDRDGESHRLEGAGFVVDVGEGVRISRDRDEAATGSAGAEDAGPRAPLDAGAPVDELPASAPWTVRAEGRGARLRPSDDAAWAPITGVVADVQGGAEVQAGGRSVVHVERGGAEATLGRGTSGRIGTDGVLLDLTRGHVAAAASETAGERLRVPGGTIVLEPRSRVEVEVDRSGRANIRPTRGRIELEGPRGTVTVAVGETVALGRDGAVDQDRGPERSHVTITAGEVATIHDPGAPTNVAIDFSGRCPGDGIIEVGPSGRGRPTTRRGSGKVIVRLAPGRQDYRVHCIVDGERSSEVAVAGRLAIGRDAGASPISNRAAANTVDADGRRYTVLYQSALPIMTFEWSDAPPAPSYTLRLSTRGRERVIPNLPRASHRLASSELTEGSYQFTFEAPSGRRSQTSTVTIGFDNAASTIWLQQPRPGRIVAGATVRVAGVALRGSSVRVGDQELVLDGQFRFAGQVVAPTQEDALTIVATHPGLGVHYFVRRLTGGP